jgi:hypothetical protein
MVRKGLRERLGQRRVGNIFTDNEVLERRRLKNYAVPSVWELADG